MVSGTRDMQCTLSMKMEKSNSKETINLLDLLSESDSDSTDLIFAPQKKKKVKRRHKSRISSRNQHSNSCGCNKSDMRIISLWLAAVLITFWLIALSWLATVLYGEIKKMDVSIKSVIAGSEGVPDALQKCHSLSRDLQNNQTIIFSRLSDLKQQINNFTVQLAHIQQDLQKVQEYFQAAPEMANLPKRLDELSTSVATFGSQIRDLGATVNTLKETNMRVQDAQTTMQQNISSIKHTMLELSNITQKPQILSTDETQVKTDKLNLTISHLINNLTHVNETLSSKLQWVADDQGNDRKKLVSLQEATAAINTTMMSLQGECVKMSEQASVLASIQQLTTKMNEVRTTDVELIGKLKQLEQSYNGLKNSTSIIFATVSEMQNQQQINKIKLPVPLNGDVTTETYRGAIDVDITQRKNDKSQIWRKRSFSEQ
ncbi:PREDICTED: uncharacterized protein LOC108779619 isoform X2 [Cyphomyrmex costatus]|uniref:uncharacterized protein LOC108779619 isoform X2 n=1 Tax=Cyphomyrmex costatus TaxID=456900 RepID=UPI0008524388|nr:PREDICTED: uncharacterized protein LOC108779619 isoform X2 [Cyphomyrmex costatus]